MYTINTGASQVCDLCKGSGYVQNRAKAHLAFHDKERCPNGCKQFSGARMKKYRVVRRPIGDIPYGKIIGGNLKRLRAYRKRTTWQVASAATIDHENVVALENGSIRPGSQEIFWYNLERLAKYYDVSVDFLFVTH